MRGARKRSLDQRLRLEVYESKGSFWGDEARYWREDQRHRLTAGLYRIELALTSLSSSASFFTLYVEFKPSWHEDPGRLSVRAALRPGRLRDQKQIPELKGPCA
jgi:hypothetical protein